MEGFQNIKKFKYKELHLSEYNNNYDIAMWMVKERKHNSNKKNKERNGKKIMNKERNNKNKNK